MCRPIDFELLETRRLLAELALFGTGGPDHVTLWVEGPDYVVDVNFAISRHPIASVDSITISTFGGNDSIDVRDTHDAVTVQGGAGADFLYVGGGRLDMIRQPVRFEGGADDDTLVLDDWASAFDDAYTVDAGATWRTLAGSTTQSPHVNYVELENVTINASAGHNRFDVERSPAGASPLGTSVIFLNASNGDDHVRLAPSTGNLGHVGCRVWVRGGGGTNRVSMYDHNWGGNVTYTVEPTRADWASSGSVTFEDVHDIELLAGSGTNDIRVNGTPLSAPLTIFGGAGPDTLRVTQGNLIALGDDVIFHGNGGADHAIVNDQDWAAPTEYVISDSGVSWGAASALQVSGLETLTLNAGSGASGIGISITALSSTVVNVNSGAGVDTIHVHETSSAGFATIDTGPGDDAVHVNSDAAGFAGVLFPSAQDLAVLTIGDGGLVVLGLGGTSALRTRALTIAPTGSLNINDNPVIVDYSGSSPFASIQASLAQGYAGGLWMGLGIRSSTVALTTNSGIGHAEASEVFSSFPATFAGQSVDNTSILLRPTLYGDTNLDGRVNLTDFNRLAASFGGADRRWSQGDFNFDAQVNLFDFNRLAANFGSSFAAPEEPERGLA